MMQTISKYDKKLIWQGFQGFAFLHCNHAQLNVADMKKTFWIVNKLDAKTAEIYLYGYIGYYDDVTAAAFVKELKELERDYKHINIRINSGGGQVYDGFAIFNAIRNSKATIDCYIDGMAASMGGVIAMACNKIYMSRVAQFMSHRVSGGCFGNADEMERTAKTLIQLEDSICKIFAERTGKTAEDCREQYLNKGDRWLSAEECLQEGLIDDIYDATEMVAPQNISDAEQLWQAYHTQLEPTINKFLNINTDTMKKISLPISAELMTQLGLATNATDEAIATAINAELAKVNTLQQSVASLTQQTTTLQGKLDTLEKGNKQDSVKNKLADAVQKKLITQETSNALATAFPDNPEGLDGVLNTLKPYESVAEQLNKGKGIDNGGAPKNEAELVKAFDKMDDEGTLHAHAKANWDDFKAMYKAKYNKEPEASTWK